MKRFIYLLAIAISFASCQKEEAIKPAPVAPVVPTVTTPPAASQKFYVAVLADYTDDHSGAHHTREVVPDVTINGVPLTYVSFDSGGWVTSNIVDVAFEYDIPTSLNLSCEDVIDFVVSFNTDSLNDLETLDSSSISHRYSLAFSNCFPVSNIFSLT